MVISEEKRSKEGGKERKRRKYPPSRNLVICEI